ncbi:hypothetical protein D3C71_1073990 [compost metagenome]
MQALIELFVQPARAVIQTQMRHTLQQQFVLGGEMSAVTDKNPTRFIQQAGLRPGINQIHDVILQCLLIAAGAVVEDH